MDIKNKNLAATKTENIARPTNEEIMWARNQKKVRRKEKSEQDVQRENENFTEDYLRSAARSDIDYLMDRHVHRSGVSAFDRLHPGTLDFLEKFRPGITQARGISENRDFLTKKLDGSVSDIPNCELPREEKSTAEIKNLMMLRSEVNSNIDEPIEASRYSGYQYPNCSGVMPMEGSLWKNTATTYNQPGKSKHLSPKSPASILIERGELWSGRSEIQEVIPSLCITNLFGAKNAGVLAVNKISHIVICADELPKVFPDQFEYLKLEGLTDNTGTPLDAHLEKALPWVKSAIKQGGRVLLHCASGSSRSGAVLIAYLMWEIKLPASEAFKLAQKYRPIILPNPGFYEQLQSLGAGSQIFAKLG